MNPNWHTFLARHGATITENSTRHFGDAANELLATAQSTVLCDLSQVGTLRVSGEDAQSFLQNLLSNDIREISATRAQMSSLNSPKGRVLATMMIRRENDDYLLQMPRVLCEATRKKLSMYVLRAKVKIQDTSDEIISLGVSGENALSILNKVFGELPQSMLGIIGTEHGIVIKISDTSFQIEASLEQAVHLWEELCKNAQPVGSACWDWLSIHSGIPVILPQTQEQFVAQMVNLDLINAVSFKKGCYPGQEIVARMQYLGKLKKRMYLAHLDSTAAPQPGDELFSADMEGQTSGMIVNASPAPSGGFDVLAVVQTSSRETQTVHWSTLHGTALNFLPLPYSIPSN